MNPFLKNILYRIKKHNMRVQLYNVVLFLAEMKRFELLRRFEPTYRISSADPSTTWVHLQIFIPTREGFCKS